MIGSFRKSEIKATTLFATIGARISSNTIVPEHCNPHAHYLVAPEFPIHGALRCVRTWLARFLWEKILGRLAWTLSRLADTRFDSGDMLF